MEDKISMTKVIVIILTIIIITYILYLATSAGKILESTINVLLYPLPKDVKKRITNNIENIIDNRNNIIKDIEKSIAINITKNLPTDVVKSIIDSVPRELIDDDRCKKRPSGKFIPDTNSNDLPWDNVNKCDNNKGSNGDINLNNSDFSERIKSSKSKIILY